MAVTGTREAFQTFAVSCNGYAWYKGGFVPPQPGLKYGFLNGRIYDPKLAHADRFNKEGPRYLLEEVLGVRYQGRLGTRVTYLTPEDRPTGLSGFTLTRS